MSNADGRGYWTACLSPPLLQQEAKVSSLDQTGRLRPAAALLSPNRS